MRIFFLPNNIASMTAITVNALNESGHEAKGLILKGDINQSHSNLKIISFKKSWISKILGLLKWYLYFIKYLFWTDVVHWNGCFNVPLLRYTLPVIKLLKKPAFIEFVGSDVRIPEIEFNDNPYYKSVFNNGYEYSYENGTRSKEIQSKFANAGFTALSLPSIDQHIDKNIFKNKIKVFHRIEIANFDFNPPDTNNTNPLIVHSTTAPIGKGSKYVINAIETLKNKHKFNFILIKEMTHAEALSAIRKCDIYVDQLISGGYGMAALEAMSFGKPVICYMKESVLKNDYPEDIPIVNANPDNITSVLEILIKDASYRNALGKSSRDYVKKYHDVSVSIPNLIDAYKKML